MNRLSRLCTLSKDIFILGDLNCNVLNTSDGNARALLDFCSAFKVARYSFFLKMEIYDLDPYFWKIITCLKIKTMTFQNGRYFGFKVI